MLERLHKRTRPISWYGERLKRDGGHAYITSAVFALPRLPKDRVAIGGASFQPEYLKQAFFPQMLDALIAYKLGEDGGNPLAMAVYAADGHAESNTSMGYWIKPLAASAAWGDGKPEVTRNLACRMHAPLTSLFMGRLDPASGTVDYCSAGHPPALLLRADGRLELLSEGGMLLGMAGDASYRTGRVELGTGDILLAYSDGVVESCNNSDQEFGYERLEAQLRAAGSASADAVLFSILGAVQDFAAPNVLADDTSLVVVRRASTMRDRCSTLRQE